MPCALSLLPFSQRHGFLHPLWLYREAADAAALEPWDYPEFTRYPVRPGKANSNLRRIENQAPYADAPTPLASFAASARQLPGWWWPGAITSAGK